MKGSKERIYKILIGLSTLIGSWLGIYAQSITYFIADYTIGRKDFPLIECLTVLTLLSVGLFVMIPIGISYRLKKLGLDKKTFNKYFWTNAFVGVFVSFWSIIVAIAWWG